MKALLLLILGVSVILITAFIETVHDYYVTADTRGVYKRQWKFYGQSIVAAFLALLTGFNVYLTDWSGLLVFPLLYLLFWIIHDCFMGIWLGKGPWYLGNAGWDAWMKRIFFNGKILFGVKIFLFVLLTCMYLWPNGLF